MRAVLNLGAKLLGTDINRRLGEIVAGTQFTVLLNEPSLLNGMYRIIVIQYGVGPAADPDHAAAFHLCNVCL